MNGQVWAAAIGIAASGLLGLAGIVQAHRANKHASASSAVAKEALMLSQSAEERASRVERIALERRDITWVATYVNDVQTLSLRNVGTDTAHDVELVVDPHDGDRRSASLPSVPPTDRIGVRLTELANEAAREWKEMVASGYIGGPGFAVAARVTWKSQAGVPGIQTWEDFQC